MAPVWSVILSLTNSEVGLPFRLRLRESDTDWQFLLTGLAAKVGMDLDQSDCTTRVGRGRLCDVEPLLQNGHHYSLAACSSRKMLLTEVADAVL